MTIFIRGSMRLLYILKFFRHSPFKETDKKDIFAVG